MRTRLHSRVKHLVEPRVDILPGALGRGALLVVDVQQVVSDDEQTVSDRIRLFGPADDGLRNREHPVADDGGIHVLAGFGGMGQLAEVEIREDKLQHMLALGVGYLQPGGVHPPLLDVVQHSFHRLECRGIVTGPELQGTLPVGYHDGPLFLADLHGGSPFVEVDGRHLVEDGHRVAHIVQLVGDPGTLQKVDRPRPIAVPRFQDRQLPGVRVPAGLKPERVGRFYRVGVTDSTKGPDHPGVPHPADDLLHLRLAPVRQHTDFAALAVGEPLLVPCPCLGGLFQLRHALGNQ